MGNTSTVLTRVSVCCCRSRSIYYQSGKENGLVTCIPFSALQITWLQHLHICCRFYHLSTCSLIHFFHALFSRSFISRHSDYPSSCSLQCTDKCLSDMKCTVMIWRSWVWTPVGSNLGCLHCLVLLFKLYLNQICNVWCCSGSAIYHSFAARSYSYLSLSRSCVPHHLDLSPPCSTQL